MSHNMKLIFNRTSIAERVKLAIKTGIDAIVDDSWDFYNAGVMSGNIYYHMPLADAVEPELEGYTFMGHLSIPDEPGKVRLYVPYFTLKSN